jgi:hypothetical protein
VRKCLKTGQYPMSEPLTKFSAPQDSWGLIIVLVSVVWSHPPGSNRRPADYESWTWPFWKCLILRSCWS